MLKKFILLISAAAAIAGCANPGLIIREKENNINIDGKLDEWDLKSFQPYMDGKLLIKADYDSQFIYLACQCPDRNTGRLFALNGLKVWIDPNGQNEQDLEMDISYEGQRKFDFQKGNFFAALDDNQKEKVTKKIEKINDGVLVVDKKAVESRIFSNDDNPAFGGKMLISGNDLSFELKIPRNINSYFKDFSDLKFNLSNIGITTGRSPLGSFRNMRPGGMMRNPDNPGFPGGIYRRGPVNQEIDNPEIWIKLKAEENSK